MNKNGFISLGIWSFVSFIIILIVLNALTLHQQGIDIDPMINGMDYNNLTDQFNNSLRESFLDNINESDPSYGGQVRNIIFTLVDASLYGTFKVIQLAIKATRDFDFVNAKNVLLLFYLSIVVPFVVAFIRIGLIIFVFIKDFFRDRKDRKRIQKLREEENYGNT